MMLHRYDRSLAIVIALSINVIFFWLLQRGLGHPPQIRSTDQPAIEIVWVARTPKVVEVEATVTGKPETAIKIRSPSYKPHHINTDATIATSELESISTPLSFEIIEAPHSFQRDPLEHRKLLMEHHQDRLSLNFQDRSIGGVMRRMTKSSICRELRNALTSVQGNAHIIINTMKEHGCRI